MSALGPGSTLGPYDVVGSLGAGGMGEVYRATDARLKRQVALKVLPPALTADPDRLARFQREAETLASLNHPNIAALYGLEEAGGVKALVMELVEGPTLADRLASGAMPIAEALAIARQVALALAAAHDQGIIHRDLKPANIKVSGDGDVKVLDFGLAKPGVTGSPGTTASTGATGAGLESATITSPALMTAAGMILGTAAYMSPEQAAGRPVDRRADLWSFGVVLFEMLTARRLFDGESVSHVIAAVLKDEPEWALLPSDTPPPIRKLLRRCLERDRRQRLADAGTAALECGDALGSPGDAGAPAVAPARIGTRAAWAAVAGLLGGALVAGTAAWMLRPAAGAAPLVTRFAIDLPSQQEFTRAGRHLIGLSPDGSHLAYVANRQLYLRSFRELDAAVVNGTAGSDPSEPTFSPDGQWLAFWSNGRLMKVPVDGGTALALAELRNPYGLSWIGDRIIAGQDAPPAIVEVPAIGGLAKTLLTLDAGRDEWVQSPQVVDDGRALLFTLRTGRGDWQEAAIVVHDLSTGVRTTLVERGTDGVVLADGRLVYSRDGTVFAASFDQDRRSLIGTAVPLQNGVLQSLGGFSGASQVAWSSAGTMAFVTEDDAGAGRKLRWLTRQGAREDTDLPVRQVFFGRSLALSPDGRRVAVRMLGAARSQSDVWIGEFGRGAFTRLTNTGQATDPVWTPDGARVCYENADALQCQAFDGAAPPQTLLTLDNLSTVGAVAPNGAALLLVRTRQSGFEIWHAPAAPPHKPTPLLTAATDQDSPRVSPDGRWIAYDSEESGADEVYVRPYPSIDAARWQVSTTGGAEPRWSRDGRELYYLATESAGANVVYTLTAVPILPGKSFATGRAVAVARVPYRDYDVAPDGRFLITDLAETGTQSDNLRTNRRIVVVQNWPALLSAPAASPAR